MKKKKEDLPILTGKVIEAAFQGGVLRDQWLKP